MDKNEKDIETLTDGYKDLLHIYVRVSTETQRNVESLSFQQKLGINKSKQLGLNYKIWNEGVNRSFSDQIEDQPILSKLFNEIRKGNVKHLFVLDLDRLSRNESVWYLIEDTLITHNVILHTPKGTYEFGEKKKEKEELDELEEMEDEIYEFVEELSKELESDVEEKVLNFIRYSSIEEKKTLFKYFDKFPYPHFGFKNWYGEPIYNTLNYCVDDKLKDLISKESIN